VRGRIIERISQRFRDTGEGGALWQSAIARDSGAVHLTEREGQDELSLSAETQLTGERTMWAGQGA
jgi:hypothetical protein